MGQKFFHFQIIGKIHILHICDSYFILYVINFISHTHIIIIIYSITYYLKILLDLLITSHRE